VRRQHEGLLVEWVRSIRGLNGVTISSGAIQSLICVGIAAWLLFQHFERSGIANGSDLLLIYWALKLPSLGGSLATMATQYPMQRNILLRLFEPLSVPLEPVAPAKPRSASKPSNPGGLAIEVRRGQVIASGHPLLQGLDLKITAGEHVAIVGSSGAGKSTLLGLLQGWHRLAQGELRLDGSLVSPSNIASYRRETAWVDPAIQLWNKSFQDNLTYAAQREQLDNIGAALEVASLRKVLQQLPEGLQTWLGEGGALLSGGEGQRVRFARALLQSDIRLALLDEPFRGLDRSMRIKLLNEARRWWRDATLLCVTHDVTETTSFNRVLVIEDGHIVEDGAPAQLAQRTSRYRELLDAEAQLKMRFWMDPQWRHLRLDNGQISEMPGAVKSAWEVQP
jgi:ATP-binding cassette subfamily B protein